MHAHSHSPAAPEAHHEHLSPWPLFVGIGVLLLYFGIIFRGPVLGLGIITFLAAVYGWVSEDFRTWRTRKGPAPGEEEVGPDATWADKWKARPVAWWGIVLFLLTEIMLFGALFGLYFTSKASLHPFPPESAPELPVFATLINTIILVSSGFTMHIGIMALKRDNHKWFLLLFGATILLGATFLYNQVNEYLELFHEGFNLGSGVYGASFFALTGVHGAHVTAGLAGLVAVFGRGLAGQFDSKRHLGVEMVAIYWHFVDIVWIFLFLVIYVRVV